MDSQTLLTVRFPEGITEFTVAVEAPTVGDTLKRGTDEWNVIAVETDASGHTVVTLAPSVSGGGGHVKKPAD
jgi:hypothetical protein